MTVPFPFPEPPPVTVIQPALLSPVHAQPLLVVTDVVCDPLAADTFGAVGDTVKLQEPPPVKLKVFDNALRVYSGADGGHIGCVIRSDDRPSKKGRRHIDGYGSRPIRGWLSNGNALKWLRRSDDIKTYLIRLNERSPAAIGGIVIGRSIEERARGIHSWLACCVRRQEHIQSSENCQAADNLLDTNHFPRSESAISGGGICRCAHSAGFLPKVMCRVFLEKSGTSLMEGTCGGIEQYVRVANLSLYQRCCRVIFTLRSMAGAKAIDCGRKNG